VLNEKSDDDDDSAVVVIYEQAIWKTEKKTITIVTRVSTRRIITRRYIYDKGIYYNRYPVHCLFENFLYIYRRHANFTSDKNLRTRIVCTDHLYIAHNDLFRAREWTIGACG